MYIFKLCAAILQVFDILEIGPLYHGHTQLNVCEKEELQCFLYLIQIFGGGLPLTMTHMIFIGSFYDCDRHHITL